MKRQETFYVPDLARETDFVIGGFLDALGRLAPRAINDLGVVRRRAAELEQAYAGRARDQPSVHNLRYGCAVLAAREALEGHVPAPTEVALLRDAFVESGAFVRDKTRAALDQADDAFRALVDVSKKREEMQFGPSFEFQRPRDDDRAYLLDIWRCFWNDLFIEAGHPELTQVMCAFDGNWIGAIDPGRHGVRFERKTTIGHGGTHCPFHFFRVSRRGSAP